MDPDDRQHVRRLLESCRTALVSGDVGSLDFVSTTLEHIIFQYALRHEGDILEENEPLLNLLESTLEDVDDIANYETPSNVGRPRTNIPAESLQELLSLKFTIVSIAKIYGVSRWTIHRRLKELNLSARQSYTQLNTAQLEDLVAEILLQHPNTGYKRMLGFLSARGHRVQEYSVREAMRVVDPIGVAERTRQNRAINRRIYFVRYSMERWHLDTNMKLVRYKMIIRSCIDGNSRCCTYIHVGHGNKAVTNLKSFMEGVRRYGVPRGIRCDKGGENRSIARFIITLLGNDKGQVLTGRIERFWRDLYRETGVFRDLFRSMEEAGILNIDDQNHLFVLHFVYLPRIQQCFNEFMDGWNRHKVSTEQNRTPLQLMIINRPPEEHRCQLDQSTIEEVYEYCLGQPVAEDNTYDPIRNPSIIEHSLSDEQHEALSQVDVLQDSERHGVDIFQRCLQLL